MATQAVLDAAKERNLNMSVVHPSGILGSNDYAIGEAAGIIMQILNGELPAGIKGSFNLCDVRDLAYGCIMAADKGRNTPFGHFDNVVYRFRHSKITCQSSLFFYYFRQDDSL